MDLNAPYLKTVAQSTCQQAMVDSDPAIEKLANNFIYDASSISHCNRQDIDQCKKSLFARVIKQLNQCVPHPFILPMELVVQTNPTNPDRWDWEQWQKQANQHVQSNFGYDAIETIGNNIGLNDAEKFLRDFFPSVDPSGDTDIFLDYLLATKKEPFKAVSENMQARCKLPKLLIKEAISRGLVTEEVINEIYNQPYKNKAGSSTVGASNSQASCSQLEVNLASDLVQEFLTTAKLSEGDTHAHRSKLMHQFTSILNETYRCNVSVMGINPGEFGNNPNEVNWSDWSQWQNALYKMKGGCLEPKKDIIIDKVMEILMCNLTPNMLYTAFKSSPDILDLKLNFNERLIDSKDLLSEAFLRCLLDGKPVTNIITGLIKLGCLTKETIDTILSLARRK